MDEHVEKLRKKIKTTAYARFSSARRHARLNNYSLFSLSIASFSLIFISLMQKYSNNEILPSATLELYQIISSIFIAALSLVVSFANYSITSERMRKSAETLNRLVDELELNRNDMDVFLERDIRNDYENHKMNSLNHEEFEFKYGRADRKNEESQKRAARYPISLVR